MAFVLFIANTFTLHRLIVKGAWMQDGAPLIMVEMYATSWITFLRCGWAEEEPLNGLHDYWK